MIKKISLVFFLPLVLAIVGVLMVGVLQANAALTLSNLAVDTAAGDAFILGATNTTGSITIGSAGHVGSTGITSGTVSGTTGTSGIVLTTDLVTTGTAMYMTADALTTGEGLLIDHTTSVIADGGSLARLSSTSIDTGTTTGNLLDLSSTASLAGTQFLGTYSGLTTGIGQSIVANALTTGEAFIIPHTTSVIADGGSLMRLSSSSVDTGGEIGRASVGKECRSRWSPYH